MQPPRIISRRLTPLGILIAIAGLLLSSWGILYHSWEKVSIGLSLAFLPLASSLLALKSADSLLEGLTRILPETPVEGFATPVILSLTNNSKTSIIISQIKDTPPQGTEFVGETSVKLLVPPKGKGTTHYFIIARTGKRRFGKIRAKVHDPLGLYSLELEWDPHGDKHLLSKPVLEKKQVEEVAEQEIPTLVRKITRGLGLEFYEIREYREGDDPRLIDWKATARIGKLIVKEMRKESSSPTIIALAPGIKGDRGKPYKTPFERAARIAAGLAQYLAGRGSSIGYIGLVSEPIIVPPKSEQRGLSGLLSGISSTPPQDNLPESISGIIRKYLFDYVRTRPLVILIAPKEVIEKVQPELAQPVSEINGKLIILGV